MVTPDELAEEAPCHPDSQRLAEMRADLEGLARRTESDILQTYYWAIRRLVEHGTMLREGEARFDAHDRTDELDPYLKGLLVRKEDAPEDIATEDEVVIALIGETVTSETPDATEAVLNQLQRAADDNGGGDA